MTSRTFGALIGLAVSLVLAASASATTPPTRQFQSTYAAYDPWTAWERWKPQPQCTESQVIYGSEPATTGTYPVLIYVHGTGANLTDNQEGQVMAQLAAAQGFVAVAPTYDSVRTNNAAGVAGHAACMFGEGNADNVESYACSLPEANCSDGVLVAGFSQGGVIALLAANYSPLVDAAWVMGVNGSIPQIEPPPSGLRRLPDDRVRLNIGQLDLTKGGGGPFEPNGIEAVTGENCGIAYDCLQPDGAGYYVVSNEEVADHIADHCYWESVHLRDYSCTLRPTIAGLDPGFAPPSTTPWSLISNLNWLRSQL
jgi:pimeloyl-ACP methyl ester carboxylesterase